MPKPIVVTNNVVFQGLNNQMVNYQSIKHAFLHIKQKIFINTQKCFYYKTEAADYIQLH
jgi:hypothetical protein